MHIYFSIFIRTELVLDWLLILLCIFIFYFLVFQFSTFKLLVPCGRLSSLMSAFERMLKQHLLLYRIAWS